MMDGIVFMRSSSSRSISASATERSLLLGALAMHMGVLDTRENDTQTVTRKSELWDEITRHFNANTSTPRSRQQIQTLYKNMKAKARRYEARLIEMASGIPPPDPDPISEMLLGLLHQQLRHQQRHLRNMVARDTNNMQKVDPDHSNAILQSGTSFINPEQMMQVSLSEGSAEDIDIKSELDEDDVTPEEDLVGENVLPHPFPETPATTSQPTALSFLLKDCSPVNHSPQPESSAFSPTTSTPTITESFCEQTPTLNALDSHAATGQASREKQAASFSLSPKPQFPLMFPFGITEHRPQSSGCNNIPNSLTNLSNAYNTLKTFICNEESVSKEASENARPMIFNPPSKKQRVESFSRNCRAPLSRDASCCCPEIHTKLLAMAQEEHYLKMTLLKRDGELRNQEHTMRMRILALEEEEIKLRMNKIKIVVGVTSDDLEPHTTAPGTSHNSCERSHNSAF